MKELEEIKIPENHQIDSIDVYCQADNVLVMPRVYTYPMQEKILQYGVKKLADDASSISKWPSLK